MNIDFRCDGCGKTLAALPAMAGKRVKCRGCQKTLVVPGGRPKSAYDEDDDGSPGYEMAAPAPLAPRPRPAAPTPPPSGPSRRKKARASDGMTFWQRQGLIFTTPWGILALVSVAIVLYLDFGGIRRAVRQGGGGPMSAAGPSNDIPTVPTGSIALPSFPDLGPAVEVEPGIMLHTIALGPRPAPAGSQPGHSGMLWVYLPKGSTDAKSLPCVFIAPAGSTLMTGMDLGDGDRPEHLPWARAGFAVVAYDLDGPPPPEGSRDARQALAALTAFAHARGGVTNAHIALEYALARIPQVDPDRLFAAGHSSAGTVALLFAEHEPRLKGCAAFAPVVDVYTRLHSQNPAAFTNAPPAFFKLFEDISPKTYQEKLTCPVFLLHARDDANVPFIISANLMRDLDSRSVPCTYVEVPTGGHYDPMIQQGIPQAIAWARGLAGGGAN